MSGGPRSSAETSERAAVLAEITADVLALGASHVRRVVVDGVDGAGKTRFADELADRLRLSEACVIRASVDGFHNPSEIRYRRARHSPAGFFLDSFDYDSLIRLLLGPLSPGGSGRYVTRIHDVEAECAVHEPTRQAPAGSILIFDGIFALRNELVDFWDYAVWLEVPFDVSMARVAQRDGADPNPHSGANRRYVDGQLIYINECAPRGRATVVVENTILAHPVLHRVRANARVKAS